MKYIIQLTVFMVLSFQTSCNAEESKDTKQVSNDMESFTTRDFEIKNTESGNTLRGTLYLPETEGRHPVIITSHELGSDSHREWWVNYSKHWASEGYVVVGFDFAGGGMESRSDGKTTDMSVLTEASDLEQVLDSIRNMDFADTNRIILAGGSQGGGVATIVAASHPQEIKALLLLYPAFYMPDNLHTLYPDPNNFPETDTRNGMITIGKRYINDMYDYDYFNDMRKFSGPVLIVHGDKDRVAPLSYSQRAVETFPNAKLYVLKGAGHVFIKEEQQKEFLEQADTFLSQL